MLKLRPLECSLDLPGVMSFYLIPHLPWFVTMVALLSMCERKVSNLI